MINLACCIFAGICNTVPRKSNRAVLVCTCLVWKKLEVRFADCAYIWSLSVTKTASRILASSIDALIRVSQPIPFFASVALLNALTLAYATVISYTDFVFTLVRCKVVLMAWLTRCAFADTVKQNESTLALIAHWWAFRLANFAVVYFACSINALVYGAIKPETSLANVANSRILAGLASFNIASLV